MASKITASTLLLFLACNCSSEGNDNASTAGAGGTANASGAAASGASGHSGAGHFAGNAGNDSPGAAGAPDGAAGESGFGGALGDLGGAGQNNGGGAAGSPLGDAGHANNAGGAGTSGGSAGGAGTSGGNAGAGTAGSSGGASAGGSTGGGAGSSAGGSGGAATCIPAGLDFTPTANKYTLAVPTSIAVGDLDGNGTPDMAEISNSAYTGVGLGIFLNQGKGTFAQVAFGDTPYTFTPYTMALGDLNKDGHNDLAVSDGGGVRVFYNKGDATFPVHPLYATVTTVGSIAVGDLNNDIWPDLVIAQGFKVGVMLNAGDGSFPSEATYTLAAISQSLNSVAIGDLDHDGYGDIVYTFTQTVGVLINKHDGTFGTPATYTGGTLGPTYQNPISANIADVNADGKLDVVTANFSSDVGSMGIFLNKGDGTLATQVTYANTGNTHAAAALHGDFRVAIVDLDGDNVPDLATPNYGDGSIGFFKGVGNGTFAAQAPHAAGFFPCSVLSADFNGDGQPDLAVASNNSGGSGIADVFLSKCQ